MINSISSSQANSAQQSTNQTTPDNTSLGEDDFMKLMIEQLKNQDPLNPMDGTQFTAQLAQFSSLEQLTNLNDSIKNSINANYVLTQSINNTLSSTLIGKAVKIGTSNINYSGQKNVTLGYKLTSDTASVKVDIYDQNGTIVKTFNNLPNSTGENKLSWDFTDNDGNKLPAGAYTFKVEAKAPDNSDINAESYVIGTVQGVKFGDSGTTMVIDDAEYSLSDISEIINPDNGE